MFLKETTEIIKGLNAEGFLRGVLSKHIQQLFKRFEC